MGPRVTVATLPGIHAKVVTTSRLTTRILFSGLDGGIPVLFIQGNFCSATWWEESMLDRSAPWNFADPAIVRVLPTTQILKTSTVRLNADRATGVNLNVQIDVTDTEEQAGFHIRNRVAAFTPGPLENPDVTISGSKLAILQMMASGDLSDGISGYKRDAARFLGLFDASSHNEINLLLPPGAPLQP